MNWVLVVLPALTVLVTLPYVLSFQSFIREAAMVQANPSRPVFPSGFVLSLFATQAMSLVLMAATVVLALLDWRALRARGVAQPFHWAWSFLSVVYVVGRQIVVHNRTGRGLAPLWVYIAVYVTAMVGFFAIFAATFSMMTTTAYYP